MRHALLLSTALLLPGLAWAEDVRLTAPVAQAEFYLQGATLTRAATVDLPAGDHRLLLPLAPGARLPAIALTGATLGPVEVRPGAVADGRAFLTDAQATALAAYDDALEAEQVAEDARIRAAAAVKAAEDQATFLRTIDAGGLEVLDAEALLATLDLLGTRIAQADIARADARAELRIAERAVRDAGFLRAQAKLNLDASGATLGQLTLLAIGVTVAQAGPVALTLDSFVPQAGWSPVYDVTLAADDSVTLDRKVEVRNGTGRPLTGINITLSTADPFAQTAPNPVRPDEAMLADQKENSATFSRSAPTLQMESADLSRTMGAPAPARVAQASFDGPVVTYAYPAPVTLPAEGSVTLALDTLDLGARIFNRAAPRTDETAFLMAEVANTTGEPLLPGTATLYREGTRIGEAGFPLLAAGDTAEVSFGPQEHLRLEFIERENAEGDRGLFFTSGTRQQDLLFRIRNLSDTAEAIETRYALPYSEDEDLEISVTTLPNPDTRDVEDQRGVAQWVIDVPAAGEAEVEIGIRLDWPQGETLVWQP